MADTIQIRPYRPGDRDAVWEICFDTADGGKPLDEGVFDRQWAVDCIIRYYTDFEPESCWVAVEGDRVVGYLTATVDYRKQHHVFQRHIVPVAVLRAFLRGYFFRASSWNMLRILKKNVEPHKRRLRLCSAGYPATVHINLTQSARHQGVGNRLFQPFVERLTSLSVEGVHASVRAENVDGCAFFTSVGFTAIAEYETIFPAANGASVVRTILFGRRLAHVQA